MSMSKETQRNSLLSTTEIQIYSGFLIQEVRDILCTRTHNLSVGVGSQERVFKTPISSFRVIITTEGEGKGLHLERTPKNKDQPTKTGEAIDNSLTYRELHQTAIVNETNSMSTVEFFRELVAQFAKEVPQSKNPKDPKPNF